MVSNITKSDDNQFSGNELDGSETSPQKTVWEDAGAGAVKRITKTEKIIVAAVLMACLFAAVTYDLIRMTKTDDKRSLKKSHTVAGEDYIFALQPFIVPFKGDKEYTYITVDISLKLADKDLRKELIAKQTYIRKNIYDVLLSEAENTKTFPAAEVIKVIIINEIRRILTEGEIQDVYLTRYNVI